MVQLDNCSVLAGFFQAWGPKINPQVQGGGSYHSMQSLTERCTRKRTGSCHSHSTIHFDLGSQFKKKKKIIYVFWHVALIYITFWDSFFFRLDLFLLWLILNTIHVFVVFTYFGAWKSTRQKKNCLHTRSTLNCLMQDFQNIRFQTLWVKSHLLLDGETGELHTLM